MKKKIFTLLALFASVLSASAANEVTVSEALIPAGQQGSFDIELSNPGDPFVAFQLDVKLPDGITFVSATKSERFGAQGLKSSDQGGGVIRFVSQPDDDNNAYSGESGALFTITVMDESGAAVGAKLAAQVLNMEFARKDESAFKPEALDFNIEIIDRIVLDENATELPKSATNADVRVKRTIKTNQWSTICLPFAMSAEQIETAFGAGVQLANFTGYTYENEGTETLTVNFETATTIAANHPYLIKVKTAEDITSFTVDGVDVNPDEEATTIAAVKRTKKAWSEMTGTLKANTVLEENTLFLSGNKFYYSKGTTVMKAFRAFFDFYDELEDKTASAPMININLDGQTTRVEGLNVFFDDGQYYNLKGQKVDNPTEKGVYIKNGKKVVIK